MISDDARTHTSFGESTNVSANKIAFSSLYCVGVRPPAIRIRGTPSSIWKVLGTADDKSRVWSFPPGRRAYKLGRGRWSYNEIELIVQCGQEVLEVQQVAARRVAAGTLHASGHPAGARPPREGGQCAAVSL